MVEKKKAKPGSPEELAGLFPVSRKLEVLVRRVAGEGEERVVRYAPRAVVVETAVIEEWAAIAAVLAPVLGELGKAPNVVVMMAEHPSEIFAAVALAIHWDEADVRAIEGGDFIKLASQIIEVNSSFFARLLGPLASAMPGIKANAGDGDGPTLSVSSSATGTAIPSATH